MEKAVIKFSHLEDELEEVHTNVLVHKVRALS